MAISLNEWIRLGTIHPLQWGDSSQSIFALWPSEQAGFEKLILNGYPFLALDNLEFYFEGNDFEHLSEIVIKAWCISANEASSFFDYDWLRKDLTFPQVQAALQELTIPYKVERGSRFNTPNIRTSSNSFFAFYPESGQKDEEAILSKVYLTRLAG